MLWFLTGHIPSRVPLNDAEQIICEVIDMGLHAPDEISAAMGLSLAIVNFHLRHLEQIGVAYQWSEERELNV